MAVDEQFNLSAAIAAGKLALHFQPRIQGNTQRVIGAEGLLRWSPDGKTWSGVRSLATMSASDYALLWRWKLEQIERFFRRLSEHTSDLGKECRFFVSLNLSYKQLSDDSWAQQLLAMINRTGIPGHCIEVELTEQGTVDDAVLTASAFEQLRAVGVVIALDDFPEGGASMLRLAQFRFDKVKIDRCMVPQPTDSVAVWMKKRQILGDLIAMVERNGADAVIEGIERDVQYKFLSRLNVTEWQGFLWGAAMPEQQIVECYKSAERMAAPAP